MTIPRRKSADTFAKADNLPDAGQDVQNSKRRHSAANITASKRLASPFDVKLSRQEVQKEVVVPIGSPRKEDKQNAYLETDENIDDDCDFCWHRAFFRMR